MEEGCSKILQKIKKSTFLEIGLKIIYYVLGIHYKSSSVQNVIDIYEKRAVFNI